MVKRSQDKWKKQGAGSSESEVGNTITLPFFCYICKVPIQQTKAPPSIYDKVTQNTKTEWVILNDYVTFEVITLL